MTYLKVFTDFAQSLIPFGDAERGRLFTAMLEYAASGTDPELHGNERYIWPQVKASIDRDREAYERKASIARTNGAKSGRPTSADIGLYHTDIGRYCPDIAQDKDKDKDKDKRESTDAGKPAAARARFTPPSLDEVTAYCRERQNNVSAETFVDFYASKGWKIGKESMKDWRAAVRTWEKRDEPKAAPSVKFFNAERGYR